jgi:ABC-type polysaccharide/polyol phosphate export permease
LVCLVCVWILAVFEDQLIYERNQRYVTLLVAWLQYVFNESSGYCLTWPLCAWIFSSLNWGGLVFHFALCVCVCVCFCLIVFFFVAAILFHCGRVKGFVI